MRARSFALRLAAMALAAGLSAKAGRAYDLHQAEAAYRDLAASVVRIEARYASIFAPPAVGSGVAIDADGLIVTADHVPEGASEIWVVHPGERRQRAVLVKRAPEHDLALLRIEEQMVPLVPRYRPVRAGECVLALGNVMNAGVGIFAGIVSLPACTRCPVGTTGILTDITTPPGLSGGALVTCEDRALVGIISFGLLALNSAQGTAGIVGAVPVAALAELLREQLACGYRRDC